MATATAHDRYPYYETRLDLEGASDLLRLSEDRFVLQAHNCVEHQHLSRLLAQARTLIEQALGHVLPLAQLDEAQMDHEHELWEGE